MKTKKKEKTPPPSDEVNAVAKRLADDLKATKIEGGKTVPDEAKRLKAVENIYRLHGVIPDEDEAGGKQKVIVREVKYSEVNPEGFKRMEKARKEWEERQKKTSPPVGKEGDKQ